MQYYWIEKMYTPDASDAVNNCIHVACDCVRTNLCRDRAVVHALDDLEGLWESTGDGQVPTNRQGEFLNAERAVVDAYRKHIVDQFGLRWIEPDAHSSYGGHWVEARYVGADGMPIGAPLAAPTPEGYLHYKTT